MKGVVVIAFGGNALWPPGRSGSLSAQVQAARLALAPLLAEYSGKMRILMVFGNGPQVGAELLRSELSRGEVEAFPLDVCVASTQGTMGYVLELALRAELEARALPHRLATMSTLVRVSPDDPALAHPDKPVGPFYADEVAAKFQSERAWIMTKTPNGHRRVVASPRPLEVLNLDAIRSLLESDFLVIAGGGGGVPVTQRPGGALAGVEAVIDKDWTAALIGRALGATTLIDLTSVDYVYRSFAGPDPRPIPELDAEEARRLLDAGEFPPGSMGPKIEAALSFLASGEEVLITSLDEIEAALAGRAGTRIRR